MAQKVFINVTAKTLRVRPSAENPGTGETLLGTIDHDGAPSEDVIGYKPSHVLWHHIEDLMNRAKHWDKHLYRILLA